MTYWKEINGYPGYFVNRNGEILSLRGRKERLLKTWTRRDGYVVILLRDEKGVKNHLFIHKLVAQAFTPNPNDLPVVSHVNNLLNDNRADNLVWATYEEAQTAFQRRGKKQKKMTETLGVPVLQFSKNGRFIAGMNSIGEASRKTGARASSIQLCCSGKQKTAKGFIWIYAEKVKLRRYV